MNRNSVTRREALRASLRRCTVALTVEELNPTRVGTGFFVGPRTVLTCAHVVGGDNDKPGAVYASWNGERFALTLAEENVHPFNDGHGLDLALLHLPESTVNHPWVCISPQCSFNDELWSFGYPNTEYRGGDPVSFRYIGDSRHKNGANLNKVSGGQVFPGHSGAPALNISTGGVAGIIRTAQSSTVGEPAARLIPISAALEVFPELHSYQDVENSAIRDWLLLLDDKQITASERRFPGPRLRAYLKAASASANQSPSIATPYVSSLQAVYQPVKVISLEAASEQVSQGSWAEDDITARERLLHMMKSARWALHKALNPETFQADRVPAARQPELHDTATLPSSHENHEEPFPVLSTAFIPRLSPHAVLLGGPGAGKSFLLRYIVFSSAREWLAEAKGTMIPVYIPARALRAGRNLSEAIYLAVSESLGFSLDTRLEVTLFETTPLHGVPWLIMIDGLDELLDKSDRQRIVMILQSADPTIYRFVIASRPLAEGIYDTIRNVAPQYSISPFDNIKRFADGWFGASGSQKTSAKAADFLSELDRAGLQEAVRNPLLATIACIVFAESSSHNLPESRIELYDRFLDLLFSYQRNKVDIYESVSAFFRRYGGASADATAEKLIDDLVGALEYASYHMIFATEGTIFEFVLNFLADSRPKRIPASDWRNAVREVMRQSGIMTEEHSDFVFLHQQFQTYLGARFVARSYGPQTELLGLALDPAMEDFVAFLAAIWSADGEQLEAAVAGLIALPNNVAAEIAAMIAVDWKQIPDSLRTRISERLADIANDHTRTLADRLLALDKLARVDVAEAREILYADSIESSFNARWLADLGDRRGIDRLAHMAANPASDAQSRIIAARRLSEIFPSQGISFLLALSEDRDLGHSERVQAAREIGHFAEQDAKRSLLSLAVDGDATVQERIDAARELIGFDRDEGIQIICLFIANLSLSVSERIHAGVALIESDFTLGSTVLREIAEDGAVSAADRVYAASRLLMFGEPYAFNILLTVAISSKVDQDARKSAAMWLHELIGRLSKDQLQLLAAEPRLDESLRSAASENLGNANYS